jgi:mannose-6-phosphate isomerase class I
LHIKEGFASVHWADSKSAKIAHHHLESDMHHQLVTLLTTPFFVVLRADVFDHWHTPPTIHSFQIFFCMKGEAQIQVDGQKEPLRPGMTYLVPAAAKSIEFDGKCEMLWIRLP